MTDIVAIAIAGERGEVGLGFWGLRAAQIEGFR
jgi:hypothetical protein